MSKKKVLNQYPFSKAIRKPRGGGGGGTLIFYIYIGLADFFGVKILKFSIFLGFQKNHYFFG